jgi:hypothetical protein
MQPPELKQGANAGSGCVWVAGDAVDHVTVSTQGCD